MMGNPHFLPIGRLKGDSKAGQALVEYLIMLSMVLMVMGILTAGFQKSVRKVWIAMAKDIAAPCPTRGGNGCQPPAEIK